MTSTTSCTPLATTMAPMRKASDPDGQAFSTRVHAMPGQADGARHGVAADALLAPQRAALGGDDDGVDGAGVEALVDASQRGGEGAGRHLLVALLEQLAELDEPGADDGDLVPAHCHLLRSSAVRPAVAVVVRRHRPGRPCTRRRGRPARARSGAATSATSVADRPARRRRRTTLHHDAGAVLEVDDHERQRRLERRRHGLVDDEGLHDAPPGQRHDLELVAAARRCRWGGSTAGWRSSRSRCSGPEQPEHLVGPATNGALPGGTPIGIGSPAGLSWPRARSTSA